MYVAVHLLFSANRWELAEEIKEKLSRGVTLVCDRYALSGVAFTASKPGMDAEWCKAPDAMLPAPDVVLFMDITVEQAMQRGAFGDERYERKEFQETVRQNFLKLKDESSLKWEIIDAARSIEDVEADVQRIAIETIRQVESGKPLGKLW